MSASTDIAVVVLEARKRAKLSQMELAQVLGVSMRTIQNWEAGVEPQPRHQRAIDRFVASLNGDEAA